MPNVIVPGDIVKYRGIACYTGKSYTLQALVVRVETSCLQALPFSSSDSNPSKESEAALTGFMEFDAIRDLSPTDCTVIDHVSLPITFDPDAMSPASFSSKDQVGVSSSFFSITGFGRCRVNCQTIYTTTITSIPTPTQRKPR